jgi:hypothetical protein
MRLLIFLSVVIISITHIAKASAQDETLVTPQPEHKLLERLAGQWEFEKQSIPSEGADPDSLGTGTVLAEMVGDFFVVSRWSGKLYDMDYKAVQSLGYNVGEKKYSGIWIDSFMNYRWELGGAVDEASKELTLTTRGPGPTGDTMAFRERYRFDSADSITIIGEMQRGEQWVSFSTTHLTRKK